MTGLTRAAASLTCSLTALAQETQNRKNGNDKEVCVGLRRRHATDNVSTTEEKLFVSYVVDTPKRARDNGGTARGYSHRSRHYVSAGSLRPCGPGWVAQGCPDVRGSRHRPAAWRAAHASPNWDDICPPGLGPCRPERWAASEYLGAGPTVGRPARGRILECRTDGSAGSGGWFTTT